jgi:hypothetical protein
VQPDREPVTDYVNIRIPLEDPDLPAETLWALPLGGDRYRIANVPFLVHHVGLGDVVVAAELAEGHLELLDVVEHHHVASFSYELQHWVDTEDFFRRTAEMGVLSEGMARRLFTSNTDDHAAADLFELVLEDHAEWFERFSPDGRVVRQHGDALLEP